MVSYEVAMGLSIIPLVFIWGTLDLQTMITKQSEILWGFLPNWGFIHAPISFFVFIVTIFAETNRLPFDLAESEGELVAGFLTERNGDIKSLTETEVNRMIGRHTESMAKESTITFIVGEEVMINEGPFTSMKATIEKIEDHKVTLVVSIFGRKTPLTLDLHQIDKMQSLCVENIDVLRKLKDCLNE